MADTLQVPRAELYDAGLVRITELAKNLLYLQQNYQPFDGPVQSIIDLQQKLEGLALTSDTAQANVFEGYVGETYGLPEAIYTDPLLRALLPPIPATGAQVRPVVLRVQGGKLLRVQGGKLLGLGYRLLPNAAPLYNTSLTPTGFVASVTYNGLPGTVFSFDDPVPTTGTGVFLRLFVGSIQVGRIDFPDTFNGQGFSLLYNGTTYYGVFQTSATNQLTLS